MPLSPSVHEHWQISLWQVARSHYSSLFADVLRPQWAFSFVRSGRVVTTANGESWQVPAGAVMIHPPDVPYTETSSTAGIHEWLVFEARVSPGLDVMRLFPLPPVVVLRDGAAYSRIFEELHQVWNSENRFRSLQAAALTGEIIALILEEWQAAGSPARPASFGVPADRFAELVVFMRDHLDEKLCRETLAKRLRLHPNYLDRAFRAAYGQTPLQMLREMRLEHARTLLESSPWTLGAIALKTGLENDAYLSRVFRRRYGVSPGAYREGVKRATQGYLTPS